MARSRTWNPTAAFVAIYSVLMILAAIVIIGILFVGTDIAFRGSRSVEIPYVVTIRGDVEPPYWDFHLYGILANLVGVPLAVATLIVTVFELVRRRKG